MSRISSLRVQLMLLVFLAAVPALALVLYTAAEQRQKAGDSAHEEALRLAQMVATDQQQWVETTRELLLAAAQIPAVHAHDIAACGKLFSQILQQCSCSLYANLGAADRNGEVFCSSLPAKVQFSIAERSYFQRAVMNRDFSIGDFLLSPESGQSVIPFAYPVFDDSGSIQAIVFAGIDLSPRIQSFAETHLPPGSTITVLNHAGLILAHYPDPQMWVGKTEPYTLTQAMQTQNEGFDESQGPDQVKRLYAFAPVEGLPGNQVYVRAGIPLEIAYAEASATLERNLIALGMVTVLAFVAAWIGGELVIVRDVRTLLGAMERLRSGHLDERTTLATVSGELGQLAKGFNRMAETLDKHETERKQAEDELKRHDAHAAVLARVAKRLNSQLDLTSVVGAVCEEVACAFTGMAVSVRLYDEERDALCHFANRGLPPDQREENRPVTRAAYEDCIERMGSPFIIPDIRLHPELDGFALHEKLNVRTLVCVSMQRQDQLVGTINLFTFGQTRGFSQDETVLLKVLADEAAQAITNARLYDAVRREEQSRHKLLHQVLTAQEEERKRIARELHDETNQRLTALVLNLDIAQRVQPDNLHEALAHQQNAKQIAKEMLDNIHRLITDLRPSLLDDLGLVPAIVSYQERWLKPQGISLELQGNGLDRRFPIPIETALFRVVQEALTNVAKHSGATHVVLTLRSMDGSLLLAVEDNGKGFDRSLSDVVQEDGRGLGLRGMQERASILGGTFHLETEPGRGTIVTVVLPVHGGEKTHAQDSPLDRR